MSGYTATESRRAKALRKMAGDEGLGWKHTRCLELVRRYQPMFAQYGKDELFAAAILVRERVGAAAADEANARDLRDLAQVEEARGAELARLSGALGRPASLSVDRVVVPAEIRLGEVELEPGPLARARAPDGAGGEALFVGQPQVPVVVRQALFSTWQETVVRAVVDWDDLCPDLAQVRLGSARDPKEGAPLAVGEDWEERFSVGQAVNLRVRSARAVPRHAFAPALLVDVVDEFERPGGFPPLLAPAPIARGWRSLLPLRRPEAPRDDGVGSSLAACPDTVFRGRQLVVERLARPTSDGADDPLSLAGVEVSDFIVGREYVFVSAGSVPAGAFAPDRSPELGLPTMTPAERVQLRLTHRGERRVRVRVTLRGLALRGAC
jgi:hypothetical protein